MSWHLLFFAVSFSFRIGTLAVSIVHEKVLKKDGAIEYGATNSRWLAIAHLCFYLSTLIEGYIRKSPVDVATVIGFALYGVSVIMLVVVMRILGRLWTVKLLIARNHALIQHSLFGLVRHPNYFLSIVPELIGLALVFHAYVTLIIGGLVYSLPLVIRIRGEERIMKSHFPVYK